MRSAQMCIQVQDNTDSVYAKYNGHNFKDAQSVWF
jgi:hypothetical protein